jgi:hypothetical protein
VTGEVGLEKAVDRVVIFGAGRNFGQARFQICRRKACKGNVRIPFGALIDPGAEDADLLRRKARAFLGHDTVRIKSLDQSDEETVGAFAGDDDGAGIAPFEESFAIINAKTTFVFAATMALDATGFEDGLNFFGEINFVVRERRKLCDLLGGDRQRDCRGIEQKENPIRQAEHHAIKNLFEIEENNRRKKGGERRLYGEISGKPVNNSGTNPAEFRETARKQAENGQFQM